MLWLLASLAQAEQLSYSAASSALEVEAEVDVIEIVSNSIVDEIAVRLDIPKEDIKVEYLGLGNTRRCAQADYIDVNIPDREDFKGPIITYVSAFEAGTLCGKWTIRPRVAIWDMLPVAAQDIQAGEAIVFEYQRHRLDQLMLKPASVLDGTIATTQITEGSVILWNQVRAKPDNFDGDSVILLYNGGNLQIKTTGTLMSDAFIGDPVKVISMATNSVVQGTLSDQGVVEIQRSRK